MLARGLSLRRPSTTSALCRDGASVMFSKSATLDRCLSLCRISTTSHALCRDGAPVTFKEAVTKAITTYVTNTCTYVHPTDYFTATNCLEYGKWSELQGQLNLVLLVYRHCWRLMLHLGGMLETLNKTKGLVQGVGSGQPLLNTGNLLLNNYPYNDVYRWRKQSLYCLCFLYDSPKQHL
ncbi:uncharacterized protein [Dysidea avara]|uniref:uncharacterized protein isoform X2 n=1 Tax=Dysidea avara TaxID=196820 RepID=UPI003318FBE4